MRRRGGRAAAALQGCERANHVEGARALARRRGRARRRARALAAARVLHAPSHWKCAASSGTRAAAARGSRQSPRAARAGARARARARCTRGSCSSPHRGPPTWPLARRHPKKPLIWRPWREVSPLGVKGARKFRICVCGERVLALPAVTFCGVLGHRPQRALLALAPADNCAFPFQLQSVACRVALACASLPGWGRPGAQGRWRKMPAWRTCTMNIGRIIGKFTSTTSSHRQCLKRAEGG